MAAVFQLGYSCRGFCKWQISNKKARIRGGIGKNYKLRRVIIKRGVTDESYKKD